MVVLLAKQYIIHNRVIHHIWTIFHICDSRIRLNEERCGRFRLFYQKALLENGVEESGLARSHFANHCYFLPLFNSEIHISNDVGILK